VADLLESAARRTEERERKQTKRAVKESTRRTADVAKARAR
jgi:hypothetical protein